MGLDDADPMSVVLDVVGVDVVRLEEINTVQLDTWVCHEVDFEAVQTETVEHDVVVAVTFHVKSRFS